MSKLHRLICSLILVTSAMAQDGSSKLKMAVIVTRHGVRPPLSPDPKSPYARDSWPKLEQWGVKCAGDLTPTGFKLAALMGAYYSDYFIQKGILPPDRCPNERTYIWADNEERTMATSQAIAQGLAQKFPGCSLTVNFYTKRKDSPPPDSCTSPYQTDCFFHPQSCVKEQINQDLINASAAKIEQEASGLRKRYAVELTALQNVIFCCDSKAKGCPPQGACTLLTLEDNASGEDKTLKWTGPFSVGSTATENFLLEYANGMPCASVGWGRVNFKPDCNPTAHQSLRQTQPIHTAYFTELNRTTIQDSSGKEVPYLAAIQASNLTYQVLLRLQATVNGEATAPLVVYGGHDTNLGNIAGLLGLTWLLSDLPKNDTPPAGALVFELYQRGPKDYYVQIRYVHARMKQMRGQMVLSLRNPPEWSLVKLPSCVDRCPFDRFQRILSQAIDKKFVTPGP